MREEPVLFANQSVNSSLPETEPQMGISDALWKKALEAVNSSSSCARLSVIPFKELYFLACTLAEINSSNFYQTELLKPARGAPRRLATRLMFRSCPQTSNLFRTSWVYLSVLRYLMMDL